MNTVGTKEVFGELIFDKFRNLIHQKTGINMGTHKMTMVEGRLRPRLRLLGIKSFEDYLDRVLSNGEELQSFIDIITTNETSFFRTTRVWDYFKKEFLFDWTKSGPTEKLKVWSAASSTGEEAYSIAISCEEHRKNFLNFTYEISASDISSRVLKHAEAGVYQGRSFENFKVQNPVMFYRYMRKKESGIYAVDDVLKSKVKFSSHNLFEPCLYKNYFDIIFLRNVLIYFKPEDQEIVLKHISSSLKEGGILVIGESESLNSLNTDFVYKAPLIYQKGK